MKLTLVRHLWGVDLSRGLHPHLPHWREMGYTVIESSCRTVPDRQALFSFLRETGFGWIPQIFSNGFTPGGSVREHVDSLREQIEEALDHRPLFFNAHSGADTWCAAETEDFYGQMLELEKRMGVPIAHETHRLRPFGSPWLTAPVLARYPELKLTCDFSHWVCVCERLLPDLGVLIGQCARQCHHLHARVGFEEGPQVPDPSDPEYAPHLAAHEGWWDRIWDAQETAGVAASTLTPEFGPVPYMHRMPHTGKPLADLAKVCDWMARRQAGRFGQRTRPPGASV